MSTFLDHPTSAHHLDGKIYFTMASGLEVSFPIKGNPRLEDQTDELLNQIEISPFGLHWPEIDEDLSIRGILSGNYGQNPRQAA